MNKLYRPASLLMTIIFAIVGLIFFFIPSRLIIFFNQLSAYLGMKQAPVIGTNFFLILAVAYMYLVTLLAFLMYRNPESRAFPMLLAHAKIASSMLSFIVFVIHQSYLIYLTNGIVDGLISLIVLYLYFIHFNKRISS
jgi:hypothetical protein